jgi:hypothetical protein
LIETLLKLENDISFDAIFSSFFASNSPTTYHIRKCNDTVLAEYQVSTIAHTLIDTGNHIYVKRWHYGSGSG